MKDGIDKRIKKLEKLLFRPKIDWGAIYDTVKEMRRVTPFYPDETDMEYSKRYESEHGTRADFIKQKQEWAKKVAFQQ